MEKEFCIAPIIKNGKPCLLIRKSFQDKKECQEILNTIIKNKKIEIKAIISFRDPFTAKIRLKQLGLID